VKIWNRRKASIGLDGLLGKGAIALPASIETVEAIETVETVETKFSVVGELSGLEYA
jgi:hypothetical protein